MVEGWPAVVNADQVATVQEGVDEMASDETRTTSYYDLRRLEFLQDFVNLLAHKPHLVVCELGEHGKTNHSLG